MFVYVGSYTEPPAGSGAGISVFRFDAGSGDLAPVQTVSDVANPSFLALDARQRVLYAVSEVEDGGVATFARDVGTGELTYLGRQDSRGASPCHLSPDRSGRYVLVANYGGGTVAALPVAADGRLGPATGVVRHDGASIVPGRQEGPHPHMIAPSPDGRFVLATDLGADRVLAYRLDEGAGRLEPDDRGTASVAAVPGAGPRHFAFAPDGRTLYVINELASTLTVYDAGGERGELRPRQTVPTLPAGFGGHNTCAHVAVSSDGGFVYGSNRGHDSIAIWAADRASGALTPVGHAPTGGEEPRHFALDPTGSWLLAANQRSGTVVTLRRDPTSGALTPTGRVARTPSPAAVVFGRG